MELAAFGLLVVLGLVAHFRQVASLQRAAGELSLELSKRDLAQQQLMAELSATRAWLESERRKAAAMETAIEQYVDGEWTEERFFDRADELLGRAADPVPF